MDVLMSKIMEKSIYDFFSEEQLQRIPVVNIDKNTVFIPAVDQENIDLYYILEGKVEVIAAVSLLIQWSRVSLLENFPICVNKIFILISKHKPHVKC